MASENRKGNLLALAAIGSCLIEFVRLPHLHQDTAKQNYIISTALIWPREYILTLYSIIHQALCKEPEIMDTIHANMVVRVLWKRQTSIIIIQSDKFNNINTVK